MAQERNYQYAPDKVFPPGETLREVLEEIGMSEAEFAGSMAADVNEIRSIIKGETPVTADIAQRMESVLCVPASFWKNLEQKYRG